MNQLVSLELDGDLENHGFRVTLEIKADLPLQPGDIISSRQIKVKGHLPASGELAKQLENHWQHHYRNLENSVRIKSKKIIHRGSINQRIASCHQSAQELCDRFQNWLKSDTFRELDNRLREELHCEDQIRFLIRTNDPIVQKLPWHQWSFFERYPKAEIALSPLESKYHKPGITNSKFQIKILVILGDAESLNLNTDLDLLKQLPNLELSILQTPQHCQINNQLWEQSWDIIYFAGHSQTENQITKFYINSTESITLQELWYGLKQAVDRGLKLAIFNSCDGLGLINQLDDLQIPQMIIMRELVPDRIAQEFLRYFLIAFSGGQPLYLAVREARQRLYDQFEREFPCASWLPIICQNPNFTPPTWQELLSQESPNFNQNLEPNSPTQQFLSRKNNSSPLTVKILSQLTISSLVTTVLIMILRGLGFWQVWELKAFDSFVRLRPQEPLDSRLLVVEATEADINNYGFPLPDDILAQVIEKLTQNQAKLIGLDIFRPHTNQGLLFQQFQQNPRLIAICSTREGNDPNKPGIKPPPASTAKRLGFSDVVIDADGILRRHLLFMTPSPQDYCATNYSLAARIAVEYLVGKGVKPQTVSQSQIKIGSVVFKDLEGNLGAYSRLDTRGIQLLLNYRGEAAPRVKFSDILENAIAVDQIKDKIVLIGVSAPLAGDNFATPYSFHQTGYQRMPGVMVQANFISQILAAVLDNRPLLRILPFWLEITWVWVWGMAGGTLVFLIRKFPSWLIGISLAVGVLYGASFGLFLIGVWIPLIPAGVALTLTGGIILACQRTDQA